MFKNIGQKMKIIAWVFLFLGIAASVIYAISIWVEADTYFGGDEQMVWTGIWALIGGSLLSLLGSFVLSGFGQLIQNTDALANNVRSAHRTWDDFEADPPQTAAGNYPNPQAMPRKTTHRSQY